MVDDFGLNLGDIDTYILGNYVHAYSILFDIYFNIDDMTDEQLKNNMDTVRHDFEVLDEFTNNLQGTDITILRHMSASPFYDIQKLCQDYDRDSIVDNIKRIMDWVKCIIKIVA